MMRTDKIMQGWRLNTMLSRVTRQTGARAVRREWDDSTLDKLWGLKPQYVGIVIRRIKLA